jgi:hypothetical protein
MPQRRALSDAWLESLGAESAFFLSRVSLTRHGVNHLVSRWREELRFRHWVDGEADSAEHPVELIVDQKARPAGTTQGGPTIQSHSFPPEACR